MIPPPKDLRRDTAVLSRPCLCSSSNRWQRCYDFNYQGIANVAPGYNRPKVLEEFKALQRAIGAGKQPKIKNFGEDPPAYKEAYENLESTVRESARLTSHPSTLSIMSNIIWAESQGRPKSIRAASQGEVR